MDGKTKTNNTEVELAVYI